MEIKKTVIEVYKLKEEKAFTCLRTAKIEFKDGVFSHCDYKLDENPYSRDDWKFLKKIEEKIEEIQEDNDRGKNDGMISIPSKINPWERKEMERIRKELLSGQAQSNKMTFDDVVWPPILKCYPGMGIAVDKITPEGLQKALNNLAFKIHKEGTK